MSPQSARVRATRRHAARNDQGQGLRGSTRVRARRGGVRDGLGLEQSV